MSRRRGEERPRKLRPATQGTGKYTKPSLMQRRAERRRKRKETGR